MTMTTAPSSVQDISGRWVSPDYFEPLASIRAVVAREREIAKQLAAEGTKESRMRARVLCCRATKGENWVAQFLQWFGRAEPDGPSGFDVWKKASRPPSQSHSARRLNASTSSRRGSTVCDRFEGLIERTEALPIDERRDLLRSLWSKRCGGGTVETS